MKLVFSEDRTLNGLTRLAGTHEVDDVTAAHLLATFPKVVKKWRKPRVKRKAVVGRTVKAISDG